jgi:hypothetical protein
MRAFFVSLLIPLHAISQEIVTGADAAGRAGAAVATPQADAALFSNPAGASLTPSLVTGFLYQLQPKEAHLLSLTAVDGTAPYIDGGVSTTTLFSEDVNLIEERSVASIPLGKRSAIGVSQSYLFRDDLPKGERNFFSADAGLLLGFSEKFSVGMVLTNFPNARAVDRRRILNSGASLVWKNFRFSGEGGVNFTPDEPNRFIGRGAVEWARFGAFTVRGGYLFDANASPDVDLAKQSMALGLTYHDQRSTFDVAYEQVLAGEGFSRLTVGIRFFLPGMANQQQPQESNQKPTATPNPSRSFGGSSAAKGSK